MESYTQFEFFKSKNLENLFDYLTKAFNRDTIYEYIDYLAKSNIPFSVCLSDIDNFKHINDTYGHLVGDDVLKKIADTIKLSLDGKGVVGRFGGDEFIIVIEGKNDYQEIWDICHNINLEVTKLKASQLDTNSISLTTGIARFPIDSLKPDTLLELADKALYRGKTKGRNCFIIYLADKHKNMNLKNEKEKGLNILEITHKVFDLLTETSDINKCIDKTFEFLAKQYMFDNICIETKDKLCHQVVSPTYPNPLHKHLDFNLLTEHFNNSGIISINHVQGMDVNRHNRLFIELDKQNVKAVFMCKIQLFGVNYGVIRIDMFNKGRLWQRPVMELLLTTSKTIAMLLHFSGQNLE